MKGQTWYYAARIRPAPLVGPFRSRELDWRQLTLVEQMYVQGYNEFMWPLSAVPLRGRVFIRRYCKEN